MASSAATSTAAATRDRQAGAVGHEDLGGLRSYTEISPIGHRRQDLLRADPVPELRANKRTIGKANGSKAAGRRDLYRRPIFLPDRPSSTACPTRSPTPPKRWSGSPPGSRRPSRTGAARRLPGAAERDARLKHAWETGAKLGPGGDASAVGLDFSLARYLRRHLDDADLEAVLRAHPHGQIGTASSREGRRPADRAILAEIGPRPEWARAKTRHHAAGDTLFDLSHDGLALDMGRGGRTKPRTSPVGKWLFWAGSHWETDEKLSHMTRAREYLRGRADSLVRAAAQGKIEGITVDEAETIAKQLRSATMVANVTGLARSNAELVAVVEQWDADMLMAGTPSFDGAPDDPGTSHRTAPRPNPQRLHHENRRGRSRGRQALQHRCGCVSSSASPLATKSCRPICSASPDTALPGWSRNTSCSSSTEPEPTASPCSSTLWSGSGMTMPSP